jgi:hypothetical protein
VECGGGCYIEFVLQTVGIRNLGNSLLISITIPPSLINFVQNRGLKTLDLHSEYLTVDLMILRP